MGWTAGVQFHPPSLLSGGYQGSSLGLKYLGHEADHSLPSSAEV